MGIIIGIIVIIAGISVMVYALSGRIYDSPVYAIGLFIVIIGIGITAEGVSPGLIVDFFKSAFIK